MCGIVGFIGQEQAAPILLDGLAHLEYRGYDSAGVAVISAQGKLQVEKAVGRLKVLSEQIHGGADLEGCIGLGHTRWATHGAPNIINSHPHVSENGKFAVIHNGIIENYVEIKEFLIGQGITFKSETDTEVVAQLLEFYYNECHDFLEAVGRVLRRIEGAYALGMLCADCPDRIIAARKDAPLLLGYGKGCNFLASDVTAIIKHTRDVAYMEDGEVAVLTREGIEVYDALEQKVEKKHFTIDWEVSAAEKGGYQHFMLKEIMEQPEALRRAISPRIKDGRVIFDDLKLPVEKMREFTRIFIVACGSSYHVGMIGKYNLEHLLRRNVEVVLASEFRYSDPIVDDKSLVIVISQSGETLDTMAALREAKKRGGYILSIVNVVGSSIARESDDVLYTWAGPEIAVATTKAYSTQLAVLDMIGLAFGEVLGTVKKEEYNEAVAELQKLPEKMEQFLASESCEAIPKYASQYFNHNSVFFIGRNLDYALGLEGSLKLKEISYIHSEAYASGELKHGTISLIEDGTLVIALGTYAPLFDKAMSNVVEVKARGAEVLALTTEDFRARTSSRLRPRATAAKWQRLSKTSSPSPIRRKCCCRRSALCRCSCWRIISRSSAGVILISREILRNLSLLNKKGAPERVLLFLRPQGALYYPPHRVGDAGKGDILFLEREYPPYTPKRKDEGSSPRPPTLRDCSLNDCARCAVRVRCTWLRHESLRFGTDCNRALLS